ncbi:transcriptional regulator [Lacticaseibacillus paracasei]|uniref:helix-turn-helix transcriptional regulator n=1 Tax=Lacticaseibacillus paracasei TaxID=1597 RepID=UPI000E09721C|nr:helix-turn-helix transcriptional regulator [Lacticaseibacillus paracasei]RDF91603.1 transcriptional regulator [Lacticaseibacillus paracasei]
MENNIHVLRMRQQLTQQELADAVNVTRQTINAIENNKYDPSIFKSSATMITNS